MNSENSASSNTFAYVITIKPLECELIRKIKERLTGLGYQVVIVDGVKGAKIEAGEYFQKIRFWRAHTGRIMTPGELGCVLSHQKALALAAGCGSEQARHLVLEDDFIVSDAALEWISAACSNLRAGLLLHFGGQEGSPQRIYRYLRSTSPPDQYGLLEVDPRDFAFLRSAVAYAVDTTTAGKLAELIQKSPYVFDYYEYAAAAGVINSIRFRWAVSHPIDSMDSAIEHERKSEVSAGKEVSWKARALTDLTRKRRMQLALIWRKISTSPRRFLIKQQPMNQFPVNVQR